MKWVNNTEAKPIKSWCDDIEDCALNQAKNLANHPAAFRHIALMPDCHRGYGMPIGGVMASKDAVIPNAVGLDIGCGMSAVQTAMSTKAITNEDIIEIIKQTKELIPVGFKWHNKPVPSMLWNNVPDNEIILQNLGRAEYQLGTLGGGNHFLEIQKGNDGYIWLMLHSGSRNLGKQIGEYYHKQALYLCEKWHSELPDKDLAFLPLTSLMAKDYIEAMDFALSFAMENRKIMMKIFKKVFTDVTGFSFNTTEVNIHHNYAIFENHFKQNVLVHRKGATSAKKGQLGIIPGSMGTPSYIVEGLGNPYSFMSCSHGAGRKMGRKQASKTLTEQEATRAMHNIEFGGYGKDRKGNIDLGEAPQAYKDIDEVIKAQEDLVKVLVKLEPLGVIKG